MFSINTRIYTRLGSREIEFFTANIIKTTRKMFLIISLTHLELLGLASNCNLYTTQCVPAHILCRGLLAL